MKLTLLASLTGAALLTTGMLCAQSTSVNVQNGDMESWHDYTVSMVPLSVVDGWQGSDSMVAYFAPYGSLFGGINAQQQIFETSDAHSGQKAAQLFSVNLGDSLGVQPGAFTNGQISVDISSLLQGNANLDPAHFFDLLTFKGGEEISGQVDSVSAWIKNGDSTNSNNGVDFGFSAFALKKITADSFAIVGSGTASISPNLTQYTKVSIKMNYDDPTAQPDRFVVVFSSNNPLVAVPAPEYNSMKVDDVSYTMAGTGVKIPLMTENEMLVYPVPAQGRVFFNLKSNALPSAYQLKITDLSGRIISSEQLEQQINAKDISGWAKGVYFYQITNQKTNRMQTGKFIVK